MLDIEAYKPARMAELAETAGVAKTKLGFAQTFALATLAGAFIGFGALFYMVAVTDTGLGYGPTRLLGGLAFCLGLILVVVAGAELFTGNNLIVMAWAHGHVKSVEVLRNWAIVFAGNLVGAVGLAALVLASGITDGPIQSTAIAIAQGKVALEPDQAFFRGILCNTLVCLAVWLCFAARRVTGKIAAIIFPITAFVAIGFEHSIANMFFLPVGLWLSETAILMPLVTNLVPVTLGNIVGGAVFVGGTYWFCYLREQD